VADVGEKCASRHRASGPNLEMGGLKSGLSGGGRRERDARAGLLRGACGGLGGGGGAPMATGKSKEIIRPLGRLYDGGR